MRRAPKKTSVSMNTRHFHTNTLRRTDTGHERNFGPSREGLLRCELELTTRELDLLELIVQIAGEQPRVFGADENINRGLTGVVVGLADGILAKIRRMRLSHATA